MARHRKAKGAKQNLWPARAQRDAKREAQEKNGEWLPSDPLVKQNDLFDEYYKVQQIVSEEEFPVMVETLRQDLPTTFRVTGSRAHAEGINDLIKERYMPTLQKTEWDGKVYDPPTQIPWYPGKLAWELSAPKRVVRKTEPYKHFQKFLVGETEVGNLSRQEAVSMIPPLLMDVKPHHHCLDMCAAPGSKTAQIIEALNPHDAESSGLLIANDSDYKRTHMLVHQTGRLPSKGLMVTNLDAAYIPHIHLGDGKKLEFDRILADVPCSGDGTMRKNMEIWKKWGANDGNSLHSLQLRILDRAMRALKPGGRLVYSTCSFNPLENEAVVAAALNAYPGKFKLVDVLDQLPELKRRPGLTKWKVATQTSSSEGKKLVWHDTFEEYEKVYEEQFGAADEKDKDKKRPLPSTAWPPANATELGLEHCLRLVPHDQNTGGFFVCVLSKGEDAIIEEPAADLPEVPPMEDVEVADEGGSSRLKRSGTPSGLEGSESGTKRAKVDGADDADEEQTPGDAAKTEETVASAAGKKAAPVKQKRVKRDLSFREDPYSFIQPDHVEVGKISKWFQFGDEFQRDKLLVRNDNGEPLRTIYLVNETAKAIINNNDYTRLRLISAGVKGFVRQDSSKRTDITCKWRIPVEGIDDLVPLLPKDTIVDATLDELKIFLKEMYPPVERFSESAREWMSKLELGNLIVRFELGKSESGRSRESMILPVWKASTSMSLLIDKKEKSTLSIRLFDEDITPTSQPQGKDAKKNDSAESSEAETKESSVQDEEEQMNV